MAAGMILIGISGREHESGSKRSFPITKGANASARLSLRKAEIVTVYDC